MGDKLSSIFSSRRAWAAIASIIVIVIHPRLGIDLTQAIAIAGLASAWIVGESWRSSEGFNSLLEQIRVVINSKNDPPTP